MNLFVFPLAILIETGVIFALAMLYLGSLNAQLNEGVQDLFQSVGSYNVVTHVESCSLHMFL